MIKKIKYLDGKQLYDVISIGIKNLIVHQKTLDEINVFPVPDGDTGTNMVFTLMPILTDLEDTISDQAGIAMSQIANTALELNGHVTGIIPTFLNKREKIHKKLNKIVITKTMEERKKIGYF